MNVLNSETAKLALVAAALYAAHRFAPHPAVKTAAVALGAVIVAKRAPVLNELV